ncbi:TonB-dependent siderophore receptor [Methyloligella sp. 2.7D]|uniref:TonB-dependent siderophore receptor n=1 Tax=unclassified Methyloligella TaxID=2625955 RepID=UPI00157BD432|nr:TonB-dependent siderophore receptor [Methyloligella sp. GL2]QKP78145.1 TonB-dependent siderophore receptor [Methyloligella sp. GL2]
MSATALLLLSSSLVAPATLYAQEAESVDSTVQEQEIAPVPSENELPPIVVEGADIQSSRPARVPAPPSAPVRSNVDVGEPLTAEAPQIEMEDIYGLEGYPITTDNSYTVTDSTNGGRDPMPLKDIPQSVSVVTQERIEDQNLTSLDQAMRKTTGMVVLSNDQGRSSIFSRGYEFDTVYVDGLAAPLSSIYGTQPDLAAYDRIEVMKGPAGLYAGTGQPAGIINMVRKRPYDVAKVSATGTIGSWDYYRGQVDVSTPLGNSDRVRARVVGAYQSNDTWVDYNDNEVGVGYAIIEADLTDNTTLSFSYTRQDRDITPSNGLPAYADGTLLNVDRSTFIGADWNSFDNQSNDYQVDLHHAFDRGGYFQASARWVDREANMDYAYSGSAVGPDGNVSVSRLARRYTEDDFAADAHASLPFQALGQEQNVIFGVDYKQFETSYDGYRGAVPGSINVFHPNAHLPRPDHDWQERVAQNPEDTGIYGQLRLKPIKPLTVFLGGRVDWYESNGSTTNLATGDVTPSDLEVNGKTTPYLGAVFDLSDNVSAYASYTEIFLPNSEFDAATNRLIDPMEGEQYEIGLKASWFNDRLNASIAHFHSEINNQAVSLGGPIYGAADVLVKGVEVEVAGQVTDAFQVYAGYTYTESEYLKIATDAEGETYSSYTPKHIVQLWGKYTVQNGQFKNLHVGAGGRYLSSFYSEAMGQTLTADGYFVADTAIGYTFKNNLDLTFSVNNVFDEKYYERVGSPVTFNFYGAPRSYWLSAKAAF